MEGHEHIIRQEVFISKILNKSVTLYIIKAWLEKYSEKLMVPVAVYLAVPGNLTFTPCLEKRLGKLSKSNSTKIACSPSISTGDISTWREKGKTKQYFPRVSSTPMNTPRENVPEPQDI